MSECASAAACCRGLPKCHRTHLPSSAPPPPSPSSPPSPETNLKCIFFGANAQTCLYLGSFFLAFVARPSCM